MREVMYAFVLTAAAEVVSGTVQFARASRGGNVGGGRSGSSPPGGSSAADEALCETRGGVRRRQYEKKYGGHQTTMQTTFEGRSVTVRLDNPPAGSTIKDLKDYNWAKASDSEPFIRERVIDDFTT